MAEITKVALKVDNNSSFPNNNAGAITPSILRAFNTNMIDSLVDEIGYTADSSSWNSSISQLNAYTASDNSAIANLNAFTASQNTKNTTLATYTASVDASSSMVNTKFTTLGTYTASVDTKFTAVGASTSSLNTFTGSQNTKNTTLATYTASVDTKFTAVGASTSSLNTFTGSQNTKNTTLATYTGSNDTKWNTLGTQTGSFVTETESGSFLITASVNLNTITFTKGNNTTFAITVNTGSGGGGATDISSLNAFTASQDTKNTTLATYTASVDTKFTAVGASTSSLNTATASLFTSTSLSLTTASVLVNVITFRKGDGTTFDIAVVASGSVTPGTISGSAQITALGFVSSSVTASSLVTASVNLNTITFTKGDASTFNITVNTGSAVTTDITALNSFTASQETKDTTLASVTASLNSATASLFTSASLGLTTASFTGNTLTFTKGDTTTFGIVLPDVSGSTINTGSFATTGSNTFIGNETFQDAAGNASTLVPTSGSLMLVAKSYTSASSHISGTANLVNLIFKNNNNTEDTIVSGSGNMFINPAAPTVGFKRYVGGSGNIVLNGSNVAQISSSMAFSPTMNNNYFGGNATTFIMRGPVSSSAWTISANNILGTINIGSSNALHAEKLVSGLTMNANSIQGTFGIVANQSSIGSTTFSNNIIAGATTLNLSSSAVALQNNIINDSNFTFTNQYYSSSLGLGSVPMNRNNIGGQSNQIIISGSLPVGGAQSNSISDNFIFGGTNTIYIDVANARLSGSAVYKNVIRTGLMGNQLIVSGSSLLADNSSYGSVFVGRYNANDNRRNKTSDVVFAVGTGNSDVRKTGFLIDSGSNTFVEGTLNVSGSSSFTGSTNFVGGDANFTDQGRNVNIDVDRTIIKGQKPTLISSSLDISGSLTASLANGFTYVGNGSNRTTLVATSSFGGTTDTGSLMRTGSVAGNVLTFTKGDATTFTLTVATGSGGGGAAFPFTGSAVITGSLTITGSAFGNVVSMSITSNTASMDLNLGNYFTLTLADTATTHISASNVQPGVSATLVITTGTNSSASLAPTMLQPSGSSYSATNGSGKKDVLSIVAVASGVPFVVSTKNMI